MYYLSIIVLILYMIKPLLMYCTWPWINGFHGYEAYLRMSSLIGGPCYPSHPLVEGNALSIDNLNRLCIITR